MERLVECRFDRGELPFDPLEVRSQVRRALMSEITVLFQSLENHALQIGWEPRSQRYRGDLIFQNRRRDRRTRASRKRSSPCRHLVEHQSEREHVRSAVQ